MDMINMNIEKEIEDIKERLDKQESKDNKILDALIINMKNDIEKMNKTLDEIKEVYEIIPKRDKSGIEKISIR